MEKFRDFLNKGTKPRNSKEILSRGNLTRESFSSQKLLYTEPSSTKNTSFSHSVSLMTTQNHFTKKKPNVYTNLKYNCLFSNTVLLL